MNSKQQQQWLEQLESCDLLRDASERAQRYYNTILDRTVYPEADALNALERFDQPLPTHSCEPSQTLALLDDAGSPATVATTGARYFGFVTGAALPISVAARWLADAWDQNSSFTVMSPISGKIEQICERWLIDLLGLPAHTVAGFVSGSTQAIHCALAAARFRLLVTQGWNVNSLGLNGAPPIRIIAGDQIHGAVTKAIALLGFGLDNVEWIATDEEGRVQVDSVPALDNTCLLILQAGNVNTGAYDDFSRLCQPARDAGAWVHVDGAFGLWTTATKKLKHLTSGAELASSWSLDAHKTLNAPYDNGIVLCDDREAIVSALQTSGEYLSFSDTRDGLLTTPEMSRRARATELWALLRTLGREGINELVSGLHERTLQMAAEFKQAGFEIVNEVWFNQVMIRCDSDAETERVIASVQQSGECWAGSSRWSNRFVIRVSVCSWATTAEDVTRTVGAFAKARLQIKQ